MLRRDKVLFRRGGIPALVLTLLLAVVCAMAGFSVLQSAKEGKAPVQVAVVDQEGGLLSRFCINLVSSQSYIASLMDVQQLSEKKAMRAFEEGEVCAVIILPEGYTDDIMVGNKAAGQIILSEAAVSAAETVASVAVFGERLLAAGQYGVFAGQHLVWDRGLSDELHNEFLDKSNSRLLSVAVGAFDNGFTLRLTPYSGSSLTTEAYYAAAWFVLLESVCGLFFTALFTEDCRRSVLLRLYSLGTTRLQFMAGKYLYPFLYRLVTGILLLAGLSFVIPLSLSAHSVLCALAAFVLMSLLFGSAALWLSGYGGWQGILLALAVTGLFFCGGLVPRNMLPAAVVNIGRFLPSGAFMSLLSPLFGGKADGLSILCGILTALLFTVLAARRLSLLPVKGGEE